MKSELLTDIEHRFPIEKYFRESGVIRHVLNDRTEIAGVSANSWDQFVELLLTVSVTDKLVVSPELITCSDIAFEECLNARELIEFRLLELVKYSTNRPETTYVIGTPLFSEGDSKPTNSAILIKNGKVLGRTNKRGGATESEKATFGFVAEEPPFLIPGTKTALLICSDLATATIYFNKDSVMLKRMLELSGRELLIGREVNTISPEATSLLVLACWGVGGNFVVSGREDEYYRFQLRNISWSLMRNSNIKEVVVVDRKSELSSSRPYNALLRKK